MITKITTAGSFGFYGTSDHVTEKLAHRDHKQDRRWGVVSVSLLEHGRDEKENRGITKTHQAKENINTHISLSAQEEYKIG